MRKKAGYNIAAVLITADRSPDVEQEARGNGLYLLRKPIGWIVLATFIAVAMSAPVNLLARHMHRGLAIALSYLGLLAIPLVLGVRYLCVGLPISALRTIRSYPRGTVGLMTWGGVRGGISVALALSLPPGPARQVFLPMTYVIVLFSILVQGLSLGRVVRRAGIGEGPDAAA